MNIAKVLQTRESLATFGAVAILVALVLTDRSFLLDPNNLASLQQYFGPLCLLAVAMMMLFIVGMFDLSIGATMAAASMITVAIMSTGASAVVAVIGGLLTGCLIGCVNGALVVGGGFNPLITTLGIMYVVRGLVDTASGGGLPQPWMYINVDSVDSRLFALGNSKFLGLFCIVILAAATALMAGLVLRYTGVGRNLYLIGNNSVAARSLGIKADRIKFLIFVLMGLVAAAGGILVTARTGQATRFLGIGAEMQVIIACLVGGATIGGGRGSIWGAVAGASFMTLINNGFNAWEIHSEWQKVILGVLLIGILLVDYFARSTSRRLSEARLRSVSREVISRHMERIS